MKVLLMIVHVARSVVWTFYAARWRRIILQGFRGQAAPSGLLFDNKAIHTGYLNSHFRLSKQQNPQ
jgi:hypothetical protein